MSQNTLIIPSWLNEEFINTLLKGTVNKSGRNSAVVKYKVSPAAAPGDHYISDIYRLFAETDDGNQLYLIVKCLPTAVFNLSFIKNARLFEKEIDVYDYVFPLMCKIQKCDVFPFSPKCFLTRPYSIIVLEDLVQKGFKTVERRAGLDIKHCVEALKCLAQFHALSLCIPKEKLEVNFPDTLYGGDGKEHACKYVTNCVQSVADRVEKWPGYERFADKLRQIAESSCDRVLSLFESKSPFRVLNHGDFWTNNIMFKHSKNGEISEIKILDFQMCRYVSPAFDILYFLYTSPQEDVRLNHKNILLGEYCREFNNTTQQFNIPFSLTTEVLSSSMDENEFFGFLNAIMMLPAVLSGPEKAPDLGNVAQGKSGMEWLSGERFRHQFQNILNESEKKGCL